MTPDPAARRKTPLAVRLADRIARGGPMTVAAYMQACLQDEADGYYRTRAVLGRDGDFVTAPEISQIFGELIGLWCAVAWQQMGAPSSFRLVELGPGRGTLMRDALRAARLVPRMLSAAHVVLVETSEVLRRAQHALLAPAHERLSWETGLAALGDGPAIVIANEFLDALPIVQLECTSEGWRERAVGLDAAGNLAFTSLPLGAGIAALRDGSVGDIVEVRNCEELMASLAGWSRSAPIAALFIDYGYADAAHGDTLQAVRSHAYEHPLASPGEADLTAHVDFAALTAAARAQGLDVDGPTTQAEFLGSLGLAERASRLMAASPRHAADIEAGAARLMAPNGMGTRFKALAVRGAGVSKLPGF